LCALSWIVYSLPDRRRSSTTSLATPNTSCGRRCDRPLTRSTESGWDRRAATLRPSGTCRAAAGIRPQHRIPDHAPSRALRVLENAAHVDAIIAVSAGLSRLPDSSADRFAAHIAAGWSRPACSQRRKPGSRRCAAPTQHRGAFRRMAASTRSCTRPGTLSAQRSAADGTLSADAGQASGHGWGQSSERVPAVAEFVDQIRGQPAKRRSALGVAPGRARCRPPRLEIAALVEIPHHLDVVGDKSDGTNDYRFRARGTQRREMIGDVRLQPRNLRRPRSRLPGHIVIGVPAAAATSPAA